MDLFIYCNRGERMPLEDNKKASENKMKNERRTFLKRAVYAAPSLVVLGSLAKPVGVIGASVCPFPVDPDGSCPA